MVRTAAVVVVSAALASCVFATRHHTNPGDPNAPVVLFDESTTELNMRNAGNCMRRESRFTEEKAFSNPLRNDLDANGFVVSSTRETAFDVELRLKAVLSNWCADGEMSLVALKNGVAVERVTTTMRGKTETVIIRALVDDLRRSPRFAEALPGKTFTAAPPLEPSAAKSPQ